MTKICIFGAGAIGGYIAASLSKTDSKISLIARGPHKKAIEENGLTFIKNGKSVKTGIYKTHVKDGITLGLTDVVGDAVMDRKHHGGIDKACYLYSADHYSFWQEKFPDLHWTHGMFGENLTVDGLDESQINIGDTFEIGKTIIQVSEPRRPCSILGIRFGTQAIVKEFYHQPYPGIYVRVLKEGKIKKGDSFKLIKNSALCLA